MTPASKPPEMTPEDVGEMRRDDPEKFDSAVAKHVMGWRVKKPRIDRWSDDKGDLQGFVETWSDA